MGGRGRFVYCEIKCANFLNFYEDCPRKNVFEKKKNCLWPAGPPYDHIGCNGIATPLVLITYISYIMTHITTKRLFSNLCLEAYKLYKNI